MDRKALAEWSEIVAAIVVVISLFYVGYQIEQNTDAIEADTLNSVVSRLISTLEVQIGRAHV